MKKDLLFTGGEDFTGDIMYSAGLQYDFLKGSAFAKDTEFIKRTQLYSVWLWKKFAEQYRIYGVDDRNPDLRKQNGWRNEFWGKTMRGAALVLSYSWDETLYQILCDSARDMLTTEDSDGRFSTYSKENEFCGWDMWGRKYVLLGFQYFLEVCRDKTLAEQIVGAMCRHADYIIDHIGKEDGKKGINQASGNWGGLNSSSILEPYVRLWRLTGKKRYLDFAAYIVSEGGCDSGDVFELAYMNEKAPFEYPYEKAYEMMSCFEGLIEYYRATGIEKYKTAAINYGYKLLETEVTVIGCLGCTGERFDNAAKMQTKPAMKDDIMQETCVTVTWMKLCYQLLRLTGDSVFADAIEQSFYNAYLGSFNIYEVAQSSNDGENPVPSYGVLPIDSYSPLTSDRRGRKIAGLQFFEDHTFYSCCTCIGAAGLGVFGRASVMESENTLTFNYFLEGNLEIILNNGRRAAFEIKSGYPYSADTVITVSADTELTLRFRIPAWSLKTEVRVCGSTVEARNGEYLNITRDWKKGDVIKITLDDRVRVITPPYADGPDADRHLAFAKGAVLLAKDRRICDDFENRIRVSPDENGIIRHTPTEVPMQIPDARVSVRIQVWNGEKPITLIDYSSAGKTLTDKSRCAVWIFGKIRKI